MKRNLGSEDFVALNAKDFLTENEIGTYNSATKNYSKNEFFRLRSVIYDRVTEKTKKFSKKNIQDIAITLDKVTVQKTSYTAIMTYSFHGGKIHMVLNKLQTLSTSDYDGPGTANMLISAAVC